MIDTSLLVTFLAAASILTITPGVDTAMVLSAATSSGRRNAILATAGISLGCLFWGAAVSMGLGVVLRASEVSYTAVKLAGAGYLLWLGLKLLRTQRTVLTTQEIPNELDTGRTAFWRGLVTNLLNPKVGVFYVTFLPQFVPSGASVASYSFFLAFLHVLLTFAWFAILIMATVPLGQFLRRPGAIRTLDRLTGAVFVAFGIKLALSTK